MPSKRFAHPTGFKVEFWTRASGHDRKHRSRYYKSTESMIRAGARWESKGSDYWCRYWNGLNTWLSATRSKQDTTSELASVTPIGAAIERRKGERAARRTGAQIFSVFGVCEAAAAEVMLKDGRATLKIPAEDIPLSALYNQFGHKALFAVLVPGEQIPTFERLCKELRA